MKPKNRRHETRNAGRQFSGFLFCRLFFSAKVDLKRSLVARYNRVYQLKVTVECRDNIIVPRKQKTNEKLSHVGPTKLTFSRRMWFSFLRGSWIRAGANVHSLIKAEKVFLNGNNIRTL